jgi:hypothetical protein
MTSRGFRRIAAYAGALAVLLVLQSLILDASGRVNEPESIAGEDEPESVQVAEAVDQPRTRVFLRELVDDMPVEKRETAEPVPMDSAPPTGEVSQTIQPTESLIREGQQLMGGLEDAGFPSIVADYRTHLGFDAYVQGMERLGGRFFVMQRGAGRLVWEIDFASGALDPMTGRIGLSPRSRAIRNERRVQEVLHKANILEPGNYEVVLLIPLRLEACLVGALQRVVAGDARDVGDFAEFRGVYKSAGGRLSLEFQQARLKSGQEVPLDVHVPI